MRILTFGGSKKAKKGFKKSEKCEKMTFFQKSKKCHFSPTSRSYIPSFIWISPKLRPVASGKTNRQTDKQTRQKPIVEHHRTLYWSVNILQVHTTRCKIIESNFDNITSAKIWLKIFYNLYRQTKAPHRKIYFRRKEIFKKE